MLKILFSVLAIFVIAPTVLAAEESVTRADLLKKDFTSLTNKEKEKMFSMLAPELFSPRVDPPSGTVACFDYYRFGSVQVDLSPVLEQTIPGTPFTFSGTLKNDNPYPLVNGSVYVKIFKKEGEDNLIHQNGYPMVAFFEAGKDITLPAKGEKPFSFDWQVPANLSGGDYEADFFFTTDHRFNLLGLSFTDDVTGNKTSFHITGEENTQVFFDKYNVTLNGNPHKFADFPRTFEKEESMTAEVMLVNPTNTNQTVSLDWDLYNWDGQREENKIDSKREFVTLKPDERKRVSYTTTQAIGSVSYLLVKMTDREAASILNIRFVRDGIEETRLNFPSITDFPLQQGKETTIFSCLHSTNSPIVENSELVMDLKDKEGNVLHSYTYQGGVTGNMMGVKDSFTPEKNYDFLTLSTTLKRNGDTVESLDITYDCEKIDPNLCFPSEPLVTQGFSLKQNILIVLSLFFVGGLGFYLVRRVKRETN